MLHITVPAGELWDDEHQEFIYTKECDLTLEHSLISLSGWEAIYRKPYFTTNKNYKQLIDYIRCMTITKNVDPNVYKCLTPSLIDTVEKYLNDTPSATWFSDDRRPDRSVVTAEVIYYWMISYGISKEYEKWNLNRLLILIRVFSEKNKPQKKMSRDEIYRRNSELNAARRKKLGSKG